MRLLYKIIQNILLVSTVVIITGHQLYSHNHNNKIETPSEKSLFDIFLKVLKENHSNTYLEEYIINKDNSQIFKIFIVPNNDFITKAKTTITVIRNNYIFSNSLVEVKSNFGRAPPTA